jgi:D-alanine transaminase
MSSPMSEPDPMIETQGVAAVTLDDIRWQMCNIKAITLLPNVLLRQQATEKSSAEAILVKDGLVIEGSASNVFVIRDGVIGTPPKGPLMLPGITRDLVLELAVRHGLACQESDLPESALREADEIWITSSTREIVPVTRLDGHPVGAGRPGAMWKTMIAHYREYKEAVRSGRAS